MDANKTKLARAALAWERGRANPLTFLYLLAALLIKPSKFFRQEPSGGLRHWLGFSVCCHALAGISMLGALSAWHEAQAATAWIILGLPLWGLLASLTSTKVIQLTCYMADRPEAFLPCCRVLLYAHASLVLWVVPILGIILLVPCYWYIAGTGLATVLGISRGKALLAAMFGLWCQGTSLGWIIAVLVWLN